jgi:aldehyde dehydrogenase (NAD+)
VKNAGKFYIDVGWVNPTMPDTCAVARKIRTGMVHRNGGPLDANAPFGGYEQSGNGQSGNGQSGNGREFGSHGLQEFMEAKAIMGYNA